MSETLASEFILMIPPSSSGSSLILALKVWLKYTSFSKKKNDPPHDKTNKMTCVQQRLRSAWASAQSDQSLHCALNRQLRTQGFFMRTAKTLIRLGRCPGWSQSLLGAQVILLVLLCGSSSTIFLIWMKNGAIHSIPFSQLSQKWCLFETYRMYGSYGIRQVSNQPAQLQKLARVLEFLIELLSVLYYPKVLISLCGCAGWSAP